MRPRLVADVGLSPGLRRACQNLAGARRARKRHHDPSFLLLRDRHVLHDDEVQLVSEERHGLVVVTNHESDVHDQLFHAERAG